MSHRSLFIAVFMFGLPVMGSVCAEVTLQHDREAGRVDVVIRGEAFTSYLYGDAVRTPFLWPVLAEGGVGVTRNFPMGSDDPESRDHEHHRSVFFAFGDVNGHDHWHGERIATRSVETGSADDYAWIRVENEWLTPDGAPVVREVQELRFYDAPVSERYFDLISRLEAAEQDVVFGDDKEGLMAFRIRPEIQGNRGGILTNAEGRQGERQVYGRPSPWMDYSGSVAGHGVRGIALFDHPENFRHPTLWHVRDYGLAAANPFGRKSVGGLSENGAYRLKKGESLTFIYRFYIHSGDVSEAKVSEKYREFARQSYSEN